MDAPRAATSGANAAVAFAGAATVVARDATLDGDGARGTFHGFFEGDHDVALDVFPAFAQIIRCAARAKAAGAPARGTEKLLEEIAEAGAAKMKLLVSAARPAPAPTAGETFPTGRRAEFGALLPVRTEFVVFLALGGIAEDFVSLVDFLEFLFGGFFVLGDVGVILARQLAESLFDFFVGSGARHTQDFVIIFKLHRHSG